MAIGRRTVGRGVGRRTSGGRAGRPKSNAARRATHTARYGAGSKLPARRGRNRR